MYNCDVFNIYRARPFVWSVIALIIGILLACLSISILIPTGLVIVGAVYLLFAQSNKNILALWLIILCSFGWFQYSLELLDRNTKSKIAHTLNQQEVIYEGIVREINSVDYGFRLLVNNVQVIYDLVIYKNDIDYYVYCKDITDITTSDTISCSGSYFEFSSPRNPGEFDFRQFYHRKNIFGRIFQDDKQEILSSQNNSITFGRLTEFVRDYIRKTYTSSIGGNGAGLLQALILGDKSKIDPEIKSTFVDTGVIHVLAVSGLHVGYVLIILLFISRILRIPWGWNRLAVIVGLLFFVILTGAKPSVLRATLMTGLYILGPVVNRPVKIWNIIAAAGFFILLFTPGYLFDLGFLLSFTAVISIVYFYNLFEKILPVRLRVSSIKNKPLKYIWGLFLVSLSAQIGTLPFTAIFFNRIPIISLIANIIIVPTIGVIVALGFIILMLGWIPGIGFALGNAAWFLAEIIFTCAKLFSAVPFAYFDYSSPEISSVTLYIALLLIIILYGQKKLRKYIIITVLLAASIIVWHQALARSYLEIVITDVGQGDAIIMKLPEGKSILIDAGLRYRKRDMGRQVVLPVAKKMGIKRFNHVILSHPHNDHIGGMPSVVSAMPVDSLWDVKSNYNSRIYRELLDTLAHFKIEYYQPQRGEIHYLQDDLSLQVLYPDTNNLLGLHNINNRSIVLRLVHGKNSFLFTGDLEYEGEKMLLSFGNCLDSDLLKVAHHGSITGTTKALLELVSPEIAVISVGEGNKFKHPSRITIDRLNAAGAEVHRTDFEGAIWLRSDGEKIELVKWK